MKTISYREAMLRTRYTKHGSALLEIVRRQPGIALETLVRDHDPAPVGPLTAFDERFTDVAARFITSLEAAPKDALRRFPRGGHAVKQLCDAGALVITEGLRVYLPEDLPPRGLPEGPDENSSDEPQESESASPEEVTERRRASP